MARRRLVSREPRPEMAEEEVKEEKYELILVDARSAGWKLECGVGFGASSSGGTDCKYVKFRTGDLLNGSDSIAIISIAEEPAPEGKVVQRKMKPNDIWHLPRDHVFQSRSTV
jgi:hypothetical protein